MKMWEGRSNYGSELSVGVDSDNEIFIWVDGKVGYVNAETAKAMRKALKRAIREVEASQ